MSGELVGLLDRASDTPGGERFALLAPYLQFLERHRFNEYRPTAGPDQPDFFSRLEVWLANVPTDDEKLVLLEFIVEVFFAASSDFAGLYSAAVYGPVVRWLVERVDMDLRSPGLEDLVATELGKTWFCPLTDSMLISEFYHVLGITGVEYRPDWRSLVALGVPDAAAQDLERGLLQYISDTGISYIVLMDDFVGTGTQAAAAADFIVRFANKHQVPVLILPLISHQDAVLELRALFAGSPLVEVTELLVIGKECCLAPGATLATDSVLYKTRQLIFDNASRLGPEPFGFGTLGLAYVSYSNCPDNTVTLIHRDSNDWSPLFPRSTR